MKVWDGKKNDRNEKDIKHRWCAIGFAKDAY
jgi:hypothetical protein